MEITPELFSALVSGIYDAALDRARWPNALEVLVEAFGGSGGAFMVTSRRSNEAIHANFRQDPDAVASYNAYYGQLDPIAAALARSPAGTVIGLWETIPPAEFRRSELYADWARPIRIGDGIAASVIHDCDSVGWLAIGAPLRSESVASPNKRRLMRLLVPHLQQAMRMQSSYGSIDHRMRGAVEAFDRLAHGVVLFDHGGSLLFANRAAERIDASGDGLAIGRAGIRAALTEENEILQRLIAQARGKDGWLRAGGSAVVTRPSARRPFVIHVLPTNPNEQGLPASGALVVIVDPAREPKELASMLKRHFGLTPSEAAVAYEVLRGEGLQAVADKMSVSLSTVRIHLQRVFEKTHTHRQAELTRLLLTIEAGLELPDSPV